MPTFVSPRHWLLEIASGRSVDPKSTMLMFTEVVGNLLLAVVVVLNVVAYVWARVILNPDI